ncbi:hypothetical protein HPP92_013592 [Vanilla planifolia]|uniref:DEK-C domain-containing protein n=1 Tax=Vanilla planifolia TaxID=51239 RepID=A0A835QVV5_VANPL|nr:hypothetical protein HPP92_013592 [Vanilla planifolia]
MPWKLRMSSKQLMPRKSLIKLMILGRRTVIEDAVQSMEIDEKKEFRDDNYPNLEIVLKEEEKENMKDKEEQQKSAGDSLQGKVNKFSGESPHVEKKDSEEVEAEFETIDDKESSGKGNDFEEEDSNRDVEVARELMEVEEKKDFGQSEARQVERVVDNLKNGDEKLVEEWVDFDNNGFTEEMEDIGGSKSSMQSINNVNDSGEKNDHSNAKIDTKNIKGSVDDSHVKDDKEKKVKEEVVVVRLKDGKDMHNDKEVMDDELKKEALVTNKEETTTFNKMSRDLEILEAEIMKEDGSVNEKHEVKDDVRSMENEQKYATKEDGVDEEDDVGNAKMGRGTPLKDIPNVAYKLARKKSADLKFLHLAIFGRKGKAVDFKNNLLQFSGFVWHESEEKQRIKIKERLDKCHKDTLLDLANLFDLNVSKSSTKKEEVIHKLLDFMEAPSATTEAIASEKEQLVVSRKRKRDTNTSSSRRLRGTPTEKSRKKSGRTEDIVNSEGKISKDMEDEDDEEEKDTENGIPDEEDAPTQSESDVNATESSEAGEEGEIEGCDSAKGKTDVKTVPKQRGTGISVDRKESSNSKLQTQVAAKSPSKKPSSSKSSKAQQDYTSEKVFARKRRHAKSPKGSKSRRQVKDNSSGKKEKAAVRDHRRSRPSKADLRKTICEILKEVDFNTATFTDILKMLGMRYKMDMTPRKSSIKQMIQEELTKMADEG